MTTVPSPMASHLPHETGEGLDALTPADLALVLLKNAHTLNHMAGWAAQDGLTPQSIGAMTHALVTIAQMALNSGSIKAFSTLLDDYQIAFPVHYQQNVLAPLTLTAEWVEKIEQRRCEYIQRVHPSPLNQNIANTTLLMEDASYQAGFWRFVHELNFDALLQHPPPYASSELISLREALGLLFHPPSRVAPSATATVTEIANSPTSNRTRST